MKEQTAGVRKPDPSPFPCSKCGGVEDDLHVFSRCPFASRAWELLPVKGVSVTAPVSAMELIVAGQRVINLPPVGVRVPVWPWFLWNLWKARNKLIFENRIFSEGDVINKSIADAREWESAQANSATCNSSLQRSPAATWTPQTSPGHVVCYVDAAWDSISCNCGIGGTFSGPGAPVPSIINDSRPSVSSALMGEALAVRNAVMTASASNVRSLRYRKGHCSKGDNVCRNSKTRLAHYDLLISSKLNEIVSK
ncbi:hypothetical protein N665_0201s0126 [Sinapis alba]|nr:hypothetical protein N665_0201s0126 [Sinapis alba]